MYFCFWTIQLYQGSGTVPSFLRFSPYRIRLCGDFELGSLSYKLEYCTQKIIELQKELGTAMADLVDVKCAITRAIHKIGNYDYEDLLVKRYVFGEPWEKIATDLGYDLRYVHKLHGRALAEIKIFS